MLRCCFFIITFFIVFINAHAQVDSLVNSGLQLEKARVLMDSGLYDQVIIELKRIEPRDTNYLQSLSELADAYLSSEKYDDAIETCKIGLAERSSYRSNFLLTQGMAYTQSENFAQAKEVFDAAIKEFPFYPAFLLQKGKMYYAQGNYADAEKLFFEALNLSPFNSISHLHLGIISMLRGEKVRGMMAMGLYLAINNTNNKQLVLLERFVKNELTDEFSVPQSTDNAFTRLDGILRSRIAMDDDYKTRIPINAGIVRQYQLLFDQLVLKEYSEGDPWVKYYLPVYRAIIKNNLQDAFVYHILKSTTIKQVPEWTKKNDKTLEEFFDVVNSNMKLWREKKKLPQLGYNDYVTCWYNDQSRLESIGNKNSADKEIGLWHYFYANGVLKAKGEFDNNGEKKGIWSYYTETGVLFDRENFETGLKERFTSEGNPRQKYFLINDKVQGEVLIYHDCGALSERVIYRDGMRNGLAEVFAVNGALLERYNYERDSLHGKSETFFETGEKQIVSTYKRGNFHGIVTRYYRNGQVSSQGEYDNGKATGPWQFYHNNGKPSETGQYKNDLPLGEFKYFDRNGNLKEVRNYNDAGELHGENSIYHAGILHYKMVNENGRLIVATYFDREGKVVGSYKETNGKLIGKGHFPTGEVKSEFAYEQGKATGTWKYYTRTGSLESVNNYLDDELHGEYIDYYANNMVKTKFNYNQGKKDGLYRHYYSNGKVMTEGWYQNDESQQRWLNYHPNGQLSADEFYVNGVQTGKAYYYSIDGKLYITTTMANDKILDYKIFGESGTDVSKTKGNYEKQEVLAFHANGIESQRLTIVCGQMTGSSTIYFADGKVYRYRYYENGKFHGPQQRNSAFGEVVNKGDYADGNSEGKWIWYFPNGAIETIGNYVQDERDSLWTYYYDNGTLSKINAFENGKRQGISKTFSPDGQLIIEKKYEQGDLIAFRLAGSSADTWVSFKGSGVIKATYPDGKPALEEHYENGVLHGAEKIFYRNGKLYSHFNYNFGDYEGQQLLYFPDGKLKEKRNYVKDDEHGKWETYDITGKLLRTEEYQYGFLHGQSIMFANGKKIKEVKFMYGIPQQ